MEQEYEKVEVDEETYRRMPYPYNVTVARIDGLIAGMVITLIYSFAQIGGMIALFTLFAMMAGKYWIQRKAEKEEKLYTFKRV